MTEKRKLLFNRLEIVCFVLYFLILFVERLLAVIFSVKGGEEYALTSGNVFNYIAYAVTAASLAVGGVLGARISVKMIRSTLSGALYSFEEGSRDLAVAVVCLLYGGMMHTGFTLAGVQFASYGFLILGMILRAVEVCLSGGKRFEAVASVIFVTLFSMTIPVCYISFMASPMREFFFASEFLAVLLLVPTFGYLFYRLMKDGETSFSPILVGAMLLLSGAAVGLKWNEEINYFVLIFVGLTFVDYLISAPLIFRRKRAEK